MMRRVAIHLIYYLLREEEELLMPRSRDPDAIRGSFTGKVVAIGRTVSGKGFQVGDTVAGYTIEGGVLDRGFEGTTVTSTPSSVVR